MYGWSLIGLIGIQSFQTWISYWWCVRWIYLRVLWLLLNTLHLWQLLHVPHVFPWTTQWFPSFEAHRCWFFLVTLPWKKNCCFTRGSRVGIRNVRGVVQGRCFCSWRVSFNLILFLLDFKTRRFLFFHRLLWSSIRRVYSQLNIPHFVTIFPLDFHLIFAIFWVICLVAIKETAWNQATFHRDVVDIVSIGWLIFGVLGVGSLIDPGGFEKVDSLSFDGFGLIKRGINHNFPSFLH